MNKSRGFEDMPKFKSDGDGRLLPHFGNRVVYCPFSGDPCATWLCIMYDEQAGKGRLHINDIIVSCALTPGSAPLGVRRRLEGEKILGKVGENEEEP